MKKLLCMVCAVVLMLGLAGCGKTEASAYDRGLETVGLLAEAMGSQAYLDMMSANASLREIIKQAAKGDYSAPKAAFALSFPDEGMYLFSGVLEPAEVPDTLTDLVNHRLISAIIPQINAIGGAEILAASTVCTVSKTFVSTAIQEDMIYLYLFETGCPVAVTFTTGENSTVTATAVPILYEDFPQDDMDAMQELFGGMVKIELLTK